MKVSVMMLAYNHANFIEQAVTSALEQETAFDFELVIGEDFSADGTREILQDLAKQNPTIRLLLREKNLGMTRNFANTFENCNGEYVAFLEGDDFWISKQKLAKQLALMDANPNAALCFSRAQVVEQDGTTKVKVIPPEQCGSWPLKRLIEASFVPSCTVLYRRYDFGPFPEWFYDLSLCDWPFHVMHGIRGEILFLDEVLACYRLHGGGVWSQLPETKRLLEELKFYKGIVEVMPPEQDYMARRPLVQRLYDLANAERKTGNMKEAAAFFKEAVASERPNSRLPLRRKLRMQWRLRKWIGE